jgi:AraC-like DNA-binding protein
MISYNQLKTAQHNGSPLPFAVMFSLDCRKRLEIETLQTSGALDFSTSNYEEEIKAGRRHHLLKNEYKLEDGTPCTLEEAAAALDISISRTCTLFSNYNYQIIYTNFGINGRCTQYRNADGSESTLAALAKTYNYSESSVSRIFTEFDGDHVQACKKLKHLSQIRALKNKGAIV